MNLDAVVYPKNEDYRQLFEASPSPLLVLAPCLAIVGVSDSYLCATRTQRDDMVGKNIFESFAGNPNAPPADGRSDLRSALLLSSLNRVLATRAPDQMAIQKYDFCRCEEGAEKPEERYWKPLNVPVLNLSGEVIYIVHGIEDVTAQVMLSQLNDREIEHSRNLAERTEYLAEELQSRNDEIERAYSQTEVIRKLLISERLSRSDAADSEHVNRLKAKFRASMSHELRTPLNAIVGFSDLLAEETSGQLNEKQKRFVGHIKKGAAHLLNLINDILERA